MIVRGGTCVYVGKAMNVRKRVARHIQTDKVLNGDIVVTLYRFGKPAKNWEINSILTYLEALEIERRNPEENSKKPDLLQALFNCPRWFMDPIYNSLQLID